LEPSRGDRHEQARHSIRAMVTAKADALRNSSPDIVLGLLAGSALAPLAATLGPGGPAVASAFGAVIGGVGTNLLSALVGDAIKKARGRRDGDGQAAVADTIARDLTAALTKNDATARQLSAQVIDVLQALGGFDVALAAATGDLHDHLVVSFGELARANDRVISALAGIRREQRRQAVALDEVTDRLQMLSRPAEPPSDPGGLAPPQHPRVTPVFVTATGAAPSGEAPLEARWRAGEEGWLGDRCYLLLSDKSGLLLEGRNAGGGDIRRQALARQTIPAPAAENAYAWIRQAGHALTRERDLLAAVAKDNRAAAGLPGVAHYDATAGTVTLALSWPADRGGLPCETVRTRFPPGTLDAWRVSLLLAGVRGLALTLQRLHRRGASHRDLTPDAIVAVGNDRFALRDLGLAATGFRPGEGPADYQAPEQAFGARMPKPGSATDVYQLAAIAYHLITGRVPTASGRIPPPLHPGLAETSSDMIAAVLGSARDSAGHRLGLEHAHQGMGRAGRKPGHQRPADRATGCLPPHARRGDRRDREHYQRERERPELPLPRGKADGRHPVRRDPTVRVHAGRSARAGRRRIRPGRREFPKG
jgi:hypothetical protein